MDSEMKTGDYPQHEAACRRIADDGRWGQLADQCLQRSVRIAAEEIKLWRDGKRARTIWSGSNERVGDADRVSDDRQTTTRQCVEESHYNEQ